MGYNLAHYRTALRDMVLDSVPPYQWPDGALDQALGEAFGGYNLDFPVERRLLFTPVLNETAHLLIPVNSLLTPTAGVVHAESLSADALSEGVQLFGILRVEMPIGTPLPEDGGQVRDPARSGSAHYKQAWRYLNGWLYWRNAVSSTEAGANNLAVEVLQTYTLPDASLTWDGPGIDLPYIYLLAQRAAYQQLQGQRGRDGEKPVDLTTLIAGLDRQIEAARRQRRARRVHSRTLDI